MLPILLCLFCLTPTPERFRTEKPTAECQFDIDKGFGPTAELLLQPEIQANIRRAIGSELLETRDTTILPLVQGNDIVGVKTVSKSRNRIEKCGETPVDCANETMVALGEASLTTYLIDGKDGDLTYFAVRITLKQVEHKTHATISMWVELKDMTVGDRVVRFGTWVSALKLKRAMMQSIQPEAIEAD